MHFNSAPYLYLLAVIPVIIGFSARHYVLSRRWYQLFARREKRRAPHLAETLLLSAMAAALIMAMADPGIEYTETVFDRSGIAIAVGIDMSKSMLAEDAAMAAEQRSRFKTANRLNRARSITLSILSRLRGERIGTFIFSEKGIEIIPMTRDYGYCNYIVQHIDAQDTTVPGSNLGNAVKTGISMLEAASRQGAKILVLLSDGEDISPDATAMLTAAGQAAHKGIRIYTVGIGSPSATWIPIRSDDGSAVQDYLLDQDATILKTSLVSRTLKQIADLTGGVYFRGADENAPQKILTEILRHAHALDETRLIETSRYDLSPLLLLAAFLFAVANTLMRRHFARQPAQSFHHNSHYKPRR